MYLIKNLLQLKWRDLMTQDEVVQKTALDVQLHAEFQKSKTLGNPQYDIAFKGTP